MKTTKYILLTRSSLPRPRLDGKKSHCYDWYEDRTDSLRRLRKAQADLEAIGEKTKILREVTEISVVKEDDKW